ncbi:DUF1989 domain-containing protein [Mycolicibacterium mageritense]|uniref:DUF1989 domain-containing protein n=1 Tax=Mycolicibacterium mageritense TaxID=53462 RepID=UPI001E4BA191|nr:urea carboxylase-associated family protein [Mycolicibacterium mageritense]GJJ21428.1 hypothetical protein MTY414_51010 [Mycolicibacterium mageritense]
MDTDIWLQLNAQQLDLLNRSIAAGEATDMASLVRRALREASSGSIAVLPVPGLAVGWTSLADIVDAPPQRVVLDEFVLEPGTGKAIELAAGQLLRIEQIDGGQCVDFNCFTMADYREYLHAGRTRTLHGINPTVGDMLWSAPPRERALMYIAADTAGCNDVMFPRCSANMYESLWGFADHTNCSDIQAEAIREYGLTPDDVHDSFNLFMATRVEGTMPAIVRQSTKPGDHVELLALVDVLAVPNVCGSDVQFTSNFSINPVRVTVIVGSDADVAAVPPLASYRTQRTVADFRQPVIRSERRLRRDPSYVPSFTNVPLTVTPVRVALDSDELAALREVGRWDTYDDDATTLRDVLLSWWAASHARS